MRRKVYRFRFSSKVPPRRAEETLFLAFFAAEGIHGVRRVRRESGYLFDRKTRTCVVEASTAVGDTVVRVYSRLLDLEFGEGSYRVESVVTEAASGPGWVLFWWLMAT